MSSRSRTRIARLAQSLGEPTPSRQATPRRRRPAHGPLTRAFDDGAAVSLYTDGSDPTRANNIDPTMAGPSHARPPAVVESLPATNEELPAPVSRPSLAPPPPMVEQAPAAAPAGIGPTAGGPGAVPPDAGELAGWTVRLAADASDQAFAEDIQAILAHAQSLPAANRVPLPDLPTVPPAPVQPAVAHGVGAGASHDVFDQIAVANKPSRFDQGPVSLSVDFDRLDRALENITASADAPASVVAAGPSVVVAEPTPAVPVEPPAPAAPTRAFRVMTDVPLVAQGPGTSCHAAACASMVAWRDEVSPDTAALAAATGYWERYAEGRTAVYPDVFEAFGLNAVTIGKPPSPAELRNLVDTSGPLFVAASPPGEHAVVVAGLAGDGTETGTVVDVADPWAVGMTTYSAPNPGSRYSVPYATVLESVGTGPEHHLVIAHLRKGMS